MLLYYKNSALSTTNKNFIFIFKTMVFRFITYIKTQTFKIDFIWCISTVKSTKLSIRINNVKRVGTLFVSTPTSAKNSEYVKGINNIDGAEKYP